MRSIYSWRGKPTSLGSKPSVHHQANEQISRLEHTIQGLKARSRVQKNVGGVGIKQRGVGGLGIDAKEGERSKIIKKKSFVEFLDGGGRNSSWKAQKKGEIEEMEGD